MLQITLIYLNVLDMNFGVNIIVDQNQRDQMVDGTLIKMNCTLIKQEN